MKKYIIIFFVFLVSIGFTISFIIYSDKKHNKMLSEEVKNRYTTYRQINELYTKYNEDLRDIINKVDELNDNYSSPCFNMPLKAKAKEDIQIYNADNALIFNMDDELANKLIALNQKTGINYIQCMYDGSPTDGYQKFYFVQTDYKRENLNYLVYSRTKEKPIDISSENIKNIFFKYPFTCVKPIETNDEGFWYFWANRYDTGYNFYDRLYGNL